MLSAMSKQDLPEVERIARLAFARPWTTQSFLDELQREIAHAYVRRDSVSMEILGYAIWWQIGDEQELLTIATDPAAQRRGVARTLMEKMLEDGARAQSRQAFLDVRADNEPAIALYRSLGFERVDTRKRYYHDGVDAWVMVRHVPGPASSAVATR